MVFGQVIHSVVFDANFSILSGQVVEGMEVVKKMESIGSESGKNKQRLSLPAAESASPFHRYIGINISEESSLSITWA